MAPSPRPAPRSLVLWPVRHSSSRTRTSIKARSRCGATSDHQLRRKDKVIDLQEPPACPPEVFLPCPRCWSAFFRASLGRGGHPIGRDQEEREHESRWLQ